MKKVGIVTIDSINLGNRLQNYALQQVLKDIGYDAYTICRKIPEKSLVKRSHTKAKIIIKKILGTRGGQYIKFNEKFIRYSEYYAGSDTYSQDINKQFDYFIAGSDQIWNPIYADLPHKPIGTCDFLIFARPQQKISYAASFGVDTIPDRKKEVYQFALSDFSSISVRESAGAKIINDLLGRKARVVVDPTLLISADLWRKIGKRPRRLKNSYILVYSLDGKSALLQKEIDCIGEDRVIDVMKADKNGYYAPYGPQEFLYLMDYADEVWTNSFHATVFSLLFHKPVKTFPRDGLDMSSRITSLAAMVGLDNCFTEDGILVIGGNVDYKMIDKKIEMAKKESIEFLKNSLGVKTNED